MTEGDRRIRVRTPHHQDLDKYLLNFISLNIGNRLPVTSEVIQAKAKILQDEDHIYSNEFKATKGWLYKYLRKIYIKSVRLHGEAEEVHN